MKKGLKTLLVMSIVVSVLGLCSFIALAQELTLAGSTTLEPIVQKAAEVFMERNPDVNISVRPGGSGVGVRSIIDGTADLGNSSRHIRQSEVEDAARAGRFIVPHRIGVDGNAIVVHPDNPVKELTIEQVKDIYMGKIKNWSEIGGNNRPIVVVTRDTASGTFGAFSDMVMNRERIMAGALTQASNGAIRTTVSTTPDAIGYVGLGYLSSGIKALDISVDGNNYYAPSIETINSGDYPISRPLFIISNGWPEGIAIEFLNFILGPEGQYLVFETGFVPLYSVEKIENAFLVK